MSNRSTSVEDGSHVSTKLHVANITVGSDSQELRQKFEPYGRVLECEIIRNYAFIHFETQEEAARAIKHMDGQEFNGSVMTVKLSVSRVRQKPNMNDSNTCFRCGQPGHWTSNCPERDHSRPTRGRPPSRRSHPYGYPPPRRAEYRDPYYLPPPDPYYDRYQAYYDYYRRDPYRNYPYPPPPPSYYGDPYHNPAVPETTAPVADATGAHAPAKNSEYFYSDQFDY